MRLSRRLAITALTFVSAASLVACGGASDSTNSAAPATAASADTAITGEVTVFAAASLQDAFQELATFFEAAHAGVHITFDFQGSQDLVTALDGGSPADVLATANNSTMTDAANKGLVGEQTEFATNVLTLIVPAGNPAGVTGINDGSLDNADLVICAPEVPCGEATAKLADELGGELLCGLAAGDLGGADDQVGLVQGAVVDAGDARRVAGRYDEGQDIGGELGLLADQALARGVGHGRVVGGGQDVGGRAPVQGGDELLGSLEVEGDVDARVGVLEGLGQFLEGVLEGGGREDGDLAGDVRAGGGALGAGRRGRGARRVGGGAPARDERGGGDE